MGYYDVNYDRLVWQLLPVRLRKVVTYAWLKVLVAPVKYMQGLFLAFRRGNLYKLQHNGQVCYLEAVLNDSFDPIARRIYISDPPYVDPKYIYRENELKPLPVYRISEALPVYIYASSELFTESTAFIVNVPSAVSFDPARMKALIDLYKLVGRIYTINVF